MRWVSAITIGFVVLFLAVGVAWAGDKLSDGDYHATKIAGGGPDQFNFNVDGDILTWDGLVEYEWNEELRLHVAFNGDAININAAGNGYLHTGSSQSAGSYTKIP